MTQASNVSASAGLDKLGEALQSQTTEVAFDSILDAGPNVKVRRLDGQGLDTPSDLVLTGRIVDVAGAYGLVHQQDPNTELWTTSRAEFGAGVPVVNLTIDVDEVLAYSTQLEDFPEFVPRDEVIIEYGPTLDHAQPDILAKEFGELGTVILYLQLSWRQLDGEAAPPHLEPILFGAGIGLVESSGLVRFPAIEAFNPDLLPDDLDLGTLRTALAGARSDGPPDGDNEAADQ